MSLETWKKEFYLKPADETTKEEATQHSLQKWIGLRPGNLEKHGIQKTSFNELTDEDEDTFYVDAETCALCCHHFRVVKGVIISCASCPLFKVRDGKNCHTDCRLEETNSPFDAFTDDDKKDPEPMIYWLQKTLKMLGQEQQSQPPPIDLIELGI